MLRHAVVQCKSTLCEDFSAPDARPRDRDAGLLAKRSEGSGGRFVLAQTRFGASGEHVLKSSRRGAKKVVGYGNYGRSS